MNLSPKTSIEADVERKARAMGMVYPEEVKVIEEDVKK